MNLWAKSQKIQEYGDNYVFKYEFQDHQNALKEFQWEYNKWRVQNYIYSFGLSEKQGSKFQVDNNELQSSNMYLNGGTLYFRYDQIIIKSREIVRPLYDVYKQYVQKHHLNKREQIELIMRFLQDIPYFIPPMNYQNRFIGGLFPPSELLKNGKGDCDSKSVLMAAILSHDPFYYDKLAIVLVPGHALLAIEAPPMAYDQFLEFQGRTFVYAEPVGPRRTPFGATNSPYSNGIEVFPLVFNSPANSGHYTQQTSDSLEDLMQNGSGSIVDSQQINCPDGGLLIEYERPFAPEIIKSCQVKIDGIYVKHGPTLTIDKHTGKIKTKERWTKGSKI